jgi:hypothetical protein
MSCPVLLYADDLKIFNDIRDTTHCTLLQNDLITISDWCSANNVALNVGKCCVISFTKKKKKLLYPYNINDNTLVTKDVVRDLVVSL